MLFDRENSQCYYVAMYTRRSGGDAREEEKLRLHDALIHVSSCEQRAITQCVVINRPSVLSFHYRFQTFLLSLFVARLLRNVLFSIEL